MIEDLVFGPVPSRRLGLSLGVNNIPPKHCTYSCVYCQIGRTIHIDIKRKNFYDPRAIIREVISKAGKTAPDVITFVPDGEPTLDLNLGAEIGGIKEAIRIPVAVITNSSLLFMESVREDLLNADIVSIKVDSVSKRVWKLVNRPHPSLELEKVLRGIEGFSLSYKGELISETMLVRGLNDSREEISKVAEFLSRLNISRAYISIPIRPPAEPWVQSPEEQVLSDAYNIFREILSDSAKVELLIGYEGAGFKVEEDPIKYLEATAAVHPIRLDYAEEILRGKGYEPNDVIRDLLERGVLLVTSYKGKKFLVKKLPKIRTIVERS